MANWRASVTLEMRDWVYSTYLPPRLIRIYPGAFKHASMGVAIDLGTTSDRRLPHGLRDRARRRQRQRLQQADLLRRGRDQPHHLRQAQATGLSTFRSSPWRPSTTFSTELQRRNGIELYEIHEVTVAGNTTMTHLLLGLDPRHLREEPYIPTIPAAPKLNAGELGLHAEHARPRARAAVGRQLRRRRHHRRRHLVAACTWPTSSRCSSTSAPTARWCSATRTGCSPAPAPPARPSRAAACATACAPRLEPIEDVFVDDATFEPSFRTVDDAPAVGICGSGLIDLLGELFVTGLVDKSGHLDRSAPTDRVRVLDGVPEYVVCWASEARRRPRHRPHRVGHQQPHPRQGRHLRRLRGASAAASASTSPTWSRSSSAAPSASTSTWRRRSASACCPDQPVERFHFLGNTSAQGAYAALLCVNIRHDVLDVAAKMTYLELSADNSFMDEYTSALFLPHTDLDRLPHRPRRARTARERRTRTYLERRMTS